MRNYCNKDASTVPSQRRPWPANAKDGCSQTVLVPLAPLVSPYLLNSDLPVTTLLQMVPKPSAVASLDHDDDDLPLSLPPSVFLSLSLPLPLSSSLFSLSVALVVSPFRDPIPLILPFLLSPLSSSSFRPWSSRIVVLLKRRLRDFTVSCTVFSRVF
jgi:hypothetical protein